MDHPVKRMGLKYKFGAVLILSLLLVGAFGFRLLGLNDEILAKRQRFILSFDQTVLLMDFKETMRAAVHESVQVRVMGEDREGYDAQRVKMASLLDRLRVQMEAEKSFIEQAGLDEEEEEEEHERIAKLLKDAESFRDGLDRTVGKGSGILKAEAAREFEELIETDFETHLVNQFDRLIREEREELQAIELEGLDLGSQAQIGIILELILIGALFIGILVYVSRYLIQPILSLQEAANQIARNDFDIHLEYRSQDEIGRLARAFHSMARRIQGHLNQVSTHLSSIMEHSSDAIIGQDLQGNILAWNKGAERIFGYKAEQVLGQPATLIVPPHLIHEVTQITDQIKKGHEVENHETQRVTAHNSIIEVSINSSGIRDDVGQIIGVSSIARNITQLKLAQQALNEAKNSAEKSNQAKSRFLANMSHEIRTPLNAILGFAQLAERTPLEPKQQSYIEKILEAGEHLAGIFNDLLDMASFEAGRLNLVKETFNLRDTIVKALDPYRRIAREKGLEFEFQEETALDRECIGDPARLGQVLTNLVDNAIKFTARGQIQVTVTASPKVMDKTQFQFAVSDTGIGMTREEIDDIFQPFRQVDGSTTRKFGGAGLGLNLCKLLVGLMDGDIWVESESGRGSRFCFTVLLEPADLPEAAARSAGESGAEARSGGHPLAGVNILVVDDDAVNLQVAEQMLSWAGASVTLADSGEAALAALKSGGFDAALMDIQMPGMDGYETTRKIRLDPRFKSLPVIGLSANAFASDRDRAIEAGMDGYVTKPFKMENLLGVLEGHLSPKNG